MLLKHWPEKSLRVLELRRLDSRFTALPWMSRFSSLSSEKTLLAAFFSSFGNSERRNLKCLDLRGVSDRFLERLEEFRGFYTDPYFRDSGRKSLDLTKFSTNVRCDLHIDSWPFHYRSHHLAHKVRVPPTLHARLHPGGLAQGSKTKS